MPQMCSYDSRYGRRTILRLAIIGTCAVLASPVLTSCSRKVAYTDISVLQSQLEFAQRDAQLAQTTSTTISDRAHQLHMIAEQRQTHAHALAEEISRLTGEHPSSMSTSPSTTEMNPTTVPSLDGLRHNLEEAEQSCRTAILEDTNGFQAGLFASIAAACHASRTLLLNE